MRHRLVFADIERPKHGGLRRAFALPVIDGVHQHRDTEHVGKQDELLPGSRAFLADAGEEIDRIFPFAEGEIGFADELVQRLGQFLHQEFDPRILHLLKTVNDGSGEFDVVELGHFCFVLGGLCPFAVNLHQLTDKGKRQRGMPRRFRLLTLDPGFSRGEIRCRPYPSPPLNPRACRKLFSTGSRTICASATSRRAAFRGPSSRSTGAANWSTARFRVWPISSARSPSRTTRSSASTP